MGKYFLLQCKRIARFLPGALLAMLVLLSGLLAAFSVATQRSAASAESEKIKIAMVGTAGDTMLQIGLAALKNFDSTQFSMEIVEMTEPEARKALAQGSIGAYVVIPENFVEEATYGRILPLKFVSTVGAASMVSVLKSEVTEMVSLLLLESQRGIYGMQEAMRDENIGKRGQHMEMLAFEYVECILARDRVYSLEELGIADALGIMDYLLCGFFVLFLLLACLPFASFMIRRDMALSRMLVSRGRSALGQILCDFAAYLICMLILVLPMPALAAIIVPGGLRGLSLQYILPVAFLVCAFTFLIYTLASELISGVLMEFFLALALCFVSGCLYPVHFFPVGVQKVAGWLPTGAARSFLSCSITEEKTGLAGWLILGYSLVFLLTAILVRLRRLKEAGR